MTQEQEPPKLTRRTFLDVIWNRLEVIEFHERSWPTGVTTIFKHSAHDRFGRVKYHLRLSSSRSIEDQAQTLVHEITHIDRDSWSVSSLYSFSPRYFEIASIEEQTTEEAAQIFYRENRKLAIKALGYVWRRRRLSQSDGTQLKLF